MSSDYAFLRKDNEIRYGTDIGRIGGMLLANRYDKRTHFIFELLQNAEDALRRREKWSGSREVKFVLSENELCISHCGEPFNGADVRGVCGIDESTKDITSIGRFGIGFKSVYAFTKRPEIHSGDESFAIENYVWPVGIHPRGRSPDETLIALPLNSEEAADVEEIARGLEQLGPQALLFLRQVQEISWDVKAGSKGLYMRGMPDRLDEHVRQVSLIGEQFGQADVEQKWLVFSREVTNQDKPVGYVEIAFSLGDSKGAASIKPVPEAPLVVFFPTVVSTHLGFLVQGPYRTTPSRDNVPPSDPWNQYLVDETGELLIEALRWLCKRNVLSTGTLECLPLDRNKFKGALLAPIFDKIVNALESESLLPRAGGGYVAARNARLSRTQDLRDLLQPEQLAALLGSETPISWLSSDITADRASELRQYLLRELEVTELTPETILSRIDAEFLIDQPDHWIVRLYRFIGNSASLVRYSRAAGVPLVRLEDGSHVRAFVDGQPQAFLPSDSETGFPTVRRAVCMQPEAVEFLKSLGLTVPNPVDDVIRNVLPHLATDAHNDDKYGAYIARILHAFGTDSKLQKEKLTSALKETSFVWAIDPATGASSLGKPEDVYLASARLKELFMGVAGILIVDDNRECLRGETIRELLEACGATRFLFIQDQHSTLTSAERRLLREDSGEGRYSSENVVRDYDVRGLNRLLKLIPTLSAEARKKRASLLWEALIELEDRRSNVFSGTYSWTYHYLRSAHFDAQFVRILNATEWVPDSAGKLEFPEFVLFDSLNWEPSPFLQSKINFKKPIVDELAREAGIDPEVLDLLKKYKLTSVADLLARLNVEDMNPSDNAVHKNPVEGASAGGTSDSDKDNEKDHDVPVDGDGEFDEQSEDEITARSPPAAGQKSTGTRQGSVSDEDDDVDKSTGKDRKNKASSSDKPRKFVSYVAVDPEEAGSDPDGLENEARLALEARAIEFIRSKEPTLEPMPAGNPGFDLIETDLNGDPERWVEVKAMMGNLSNRPVGLSSVQFNFAREHGEQYWLYVVEHANDIDKSRIVKIQNPAGRAGTFTFDSGWIEVAEISTSVESTRKDHIG